MIVYFATSALVPLLIEERGSTSAAELWDRADHVVSVRLVYAEVCAALAQAERMGRVATSDLGPLISGLESLYAQLGVMDIDDVLARRAGTLAQEFGLRGYDAVHLAGAERLDDTDVVLASGDAALTEAAAERGLSIARTV